MTKPADPNSKRSKRRANRNFKGSRPVKRALKRLDHAMGAYRSSDSSSHQPGAMKHW